jgi:hypothetical protein
MINTRSLCSAKHRLDLVTIQSKDDRDRVRQHNEIKDAHATRDDWDGRASPKSSASAPGAASLGLADDLSM